MPTEKYIGNSARKEYIECPYGCSLRNDTLPNGLSKQCVTTLLLFALLDRWTENEPIKIYSDQNNDLPWWIEKDVWKNIAIELIDDLYLHEQYQIKHKNKDLPNGKKDE